MRSGTLVVVRVHGPVAVEDERAPVIGRLLELGRDIDGCRKSRIRQTQHVQACPGEG